jgi:hypothetical protein
MRASFVVGQAATSVKAPILGLTDESFEPRLWYLGPEGQTDGITFAFVDKTAIKRTISLWRDKVVKEFSLPCHYLVFRYLLGSTGGFLFPSKAEIQRLADPGCTDRVVRESIGYASYNTCLLKACHAVLDPTGRTWGSQMGRKTFYYLGELGGADPKRLMRNARHKTIESAERYCDCAG